MIKKVIALLIVVGIVGFIFYRVSKSNKNTVEYQTQVATNGVLVTSISSSGSITSGNNINITTKVSGVVKAVSVTNGDTVTKGQKIAEVTLDDYAKERETTAWLNYLSALEAVKTAEKGKVDAKIKLLQDQQSILDADDDIQHKKNDEELDYSEYEKAIFDQSLEQAKKAVAVSELKYKNANAEIAAAYAKVASELRDYQENSSLIIAPSAGIISDVALAPGFIIAASSTTSNTSGATIVSAQTIGNISDPNGHLIATVSLTEMDIIYVKSNQKVSLVLDVYPDKTFTGKVLSVNTNGSSSSGVTSYPVTIILDPVTVEIYPHMGVTVEIITKISDSAILVPSSSVKSSNDGSNYLEILSNNAPQQITVAVGDSNNTQTQILSGLNEGDVVITGTTVAQTTTNRTTPSPFGNTRGVFNVGGGGR